MGIKGKGKEKMEKRRRILCIAACVMAICSFAIFVACDAKVNIKKDVLIEAGTPITLQAFFDEQVPENAMFLTDISGIDTNIPAVYQLKIQCGKQEEDVVLRIEDHTGPTGNAVPVSIYSNWKMPDAADCVSHLYDLSGIARVEYQEGTPAFTASGEYSVPVVVTDVYGNSTVIPVPFTVIADHTAPSIMGAHDLELEGNPDSLDFFDGVTVTDDYDTEPVIKVDDSLVKYEEEGTYDLIYKAIDKAGNIGTVTVKITITLPADAEPVEYEDYDVSGDPYPLAQSVMAGLWRDSDVETARAIFNWVHDTLWFRLLSGSRSYEDAAYRGFSRHNGDCYVYYACCKMLLDMAGIENMRVDRYPRYNGNIHYWLLVKLNGEWYHCDATEGYNDHPGIWFMCTDDQINDRYHQFDGSLYPMRAGGSTSYLPSPTPVEESSSEETIDPSASSDPSESSDPPQSSDPTDTSQTDPSADTSPSSSETPSSETPPPSSEETPPPSSSEDTTPSSSEETSDTQPSASDPTEPAAPDTSDPGGGTV